MRSLVRVGLIVAALGSPLGLRAQVPDLESRVDAETLALVTPILEDAARDSLPVDALRAKVLEGVAKSVPRDRIGSAVSELANELRAVRSGLRARLPETAIGDGELLAAARAARQGVSIEVLETVWASRTNGEPLDVPVTVLGELVRRGVPAPEAADVMSHVVRTRVPPHVAAQIPGRLDGARVRGDPPAAALGDALRSLHIPDPPGRRRRPNG